MSEIDAIRKLNEWGGQPLPVSASCWHDGVLALRLSGAGRRRCGRKSLGGEVMPDAAASGPACANSAMPSSPASAAVAPVGALDHRRHRARRRAADRVGRGAALAARGRRRRDADSIRATVRRVRRPRDPVPRRRQGGVGVFQPLAPPWRASTSA
jgi:hypothetical protein